MAAVATDSCGSQDHLIPTQEHSPFCLIFLEYLSLSELLFFQTSFKISFTCLTSMHDSSGSNCIGYKDQWVTSFLVSPASELCDSLWT